MDTKSKDIKFFWIQNSKICKLAELKGQEASVQTNFQGSFITKDNHSLKNKCSKNLKFLSISIKKT